jgi:hypothetical protein
MALSAVKKKRVGCQKKGVSRATGSTQPSFFNTLQGVWISDKTLFQVFDIASQTH